MAVGDKIQIRQGPSGTFLEGDADNQVPLWDDTLKRWGAGAIPAQAGARLSNEFFVDGGSSATTHDGSMEAPFLTIQEGVNAIQSLPVGVLDATLFVAAYDYEMEGTIVADFNGMNNVTIQSGSYSSNAAFRGRGLSPTAQVRIAGLFAINIGGMHLNGVLCTADAVFVDGLLSCQGCILTDVANTNEIAFLNSVLFDVVTSGAINIDGCQIGAGATLETSSPQVEITGTMVGDSLSPGTCAVDFTGDPGVLSLDNFSVYLPDTTTPNFVVTNGDTSCPGVIPAPSGGGAFIYFWKIGNGVNFPGIQYPGGWGGNAISVTEFVNAQIVPRDTTFSKMRIKMTAGLLANNAAVFTLRINGVDTALTATVPFGGTQADDNVHSVAALAGDIFSLQVDGGANAQLNSGAMWISIEGE